MSDRVSEPMKEGSTEENPVNATASRTDRDRQVATYFGAVPSTWQLASALRAPEDDGAEATTWYPGFGNRGEDWATVEVPWPSQDRLEQLCASRRRGRARVHALASALAGLFGMDPTDRRSGTGARGFGMA